jgi:hypothetical protein
VELAIAGLVALAAVIVKLLQEGRQELKVLEAVEVLFLDLGFSLPCHLPLSMRYEWAMRK